MLGLALFVHANGPDHDIPFLKPPPEVLVAWVVLTQALHGHQGQRPFRITHVLSVFCRESLSRRGSEVAVALLQRDAAIPAADDSVATERSSALHAACKLSPRSLIVLPMVGDDTLDGHVSRLEAGLFKLAQTYYDQVCTRTLAKHSSMRLSSL
jgi:hypothetical protein